MRRTRDDQANNDKVIEEMKEVEEGDRDCRFRCVLALVGNGLEETFSGACEAPCSSSEEGAEASARPTLSPNESESTFAEISLEEKAKISHRARALSKLIDWLKGQPF